MSAFLVDTETIEIIATFLENTERNIFPVRFDQTNGYEKGCECLLLMNIEALKQRYKNSWIEMIYNDTFCFKRTFDTSNIQILKCMDCFLYQCYEGKVPLNPIYKKLEEIRDNLIKEIIYFLPEYEEAYWG